MNTDLAIRGALDSLPDPFSEPAFLEALALHGLTMQDSQLLIEKAVLEAYVSKAERGMLIKLPRAFEPPDTDTASAVGGPEV